MASTVDLVCVVAVHVVVVVVVFGALESALVVGLLGDAVQVLVQQRHERAQELVRVVLLEAAKVAVLVADELAHARRIRRRLIVVVLVQLMVANERRLLVCLLRLLPQLFDEVGEGERHLAVHAESVALVERALERVAVVRL